MTEVRPFVGTSIIIKNGNLILMGKRKGGRGAGRFSVPGGHVEFGETLDAATLRELKEEAGDIKVENLKHVGMTEDFYDDAHYITHFFQADYVSGEPEDKEPEKCEGWAWYPIDMLEFESPYPMFKPCKEFFTEQKYRP